MQADAKYPPEHDEPIESDEQQDERRVGNISEDDEVVPWDCDFWIPW